MVFMLEGEVTLCEGDAEAVLKPGDAATFKAGVAVGHFLENRSASNVRYQPVDDVSFVIIPDRC
jgi:uncharacterized cupin superfamily protein